jgi:integral membrane sensor domain MASE1
VLSEAIGALALVPLGLLFKPHYLLRHRDPRLLLETLTTLAVTLALSWAAITWLPWPFTCVIVLLMWSAVRLPRMEAFLVFLVTVMVVSLMIARNPVALTTQHVGPMLNAPWLPFLMLLLPANVMTMVMYAFRAERKHITESEERFVMRWSIPPSVWRWSALRANGFRLTRRCAISSVTARRSFSR